MIFILVVSDDPQKAYSDDLLALKYRYGVPNIQECSLTTEYQVAEFYIKYVVTDFFQALAQRGVSNEVCLIFGCQDLSLIQKVAPNQIAVPDISIVDFLISFNPYSSHLLTDRFIEMCFRDRRLIGNGTI